LSRTWLIALWAFVLGAPGTVAAQAAEGAIEGMARRDEGGVPIPFALVRLKPANQDSAALQVITGDAGHFRFSRVPVGEYHLELLRIGYRPAVSPPLHVRSGETLQRELRVASQPLQLPTVTVFAEGTCLGPTQITNNQRLAELWNETRKGVEIRRGFERQYRFIRTFRQDALIRVRIGGP
jgi:hypothetical protein